jgi:multiple sugar transport system ATP-binding protein
LVIVGPSGSGKTTVLRLMAGLERPTAGEISMNGKVLNDMPAGQREVAMVFQTPALYPHMSVQENLEFGLRLRRCSRAEMARLVEEAAEMLGLSGCLNAQPSQLSGGQRQRVAIGRAIVRRAPVLLLDEPLANLDPPLRAQLRQDLRNVQAKFRTTMIYVTHDHLEAMLMGDRLAVLRAGQLQQLQAPRTVYQRPANMFVAEFFGFPGINFFHGHLVRREGGLLFRSASRSSIESPESPCPKAELPEPNSGLIAPQAFCLPLGAGAIGMAERFLNQTVVLAIRPERICPILSHTGSTVTGRVKAKIDSVHTAGADAFIKASSCGSSFYARVESNHVPAPGQECVFIFDTDGAGLFDPVSGAALEFL